MIHRWFGPFIRKTFLMLALVGGAALAARAVNTGVIAYWPFGSAGLTDASGNGHDLEADGVTVGEYLTFDGTQTKCSTIGNIDLSAYTNITVECMVRRSHDGMSGAELFLEHTENFNNNPGGFYINIDEAAPDVIVTTWKTGGYFGKRSGDNALADGKWHHVMMTIDQSDRSATMLKLYVDGTRCDTQFAQTSIPTPPFFLKNAKLYLGSRNNSKFKFAGDIDEVRI